MDDGEVVRVHCNGCGHETRHAVCASESTTTENPFLRELGEPFETRTTLDILKCLGCEAMVVRETVGLEGFGEGAPCFYPSPISRRFPSRLSRLPPNILAVIEEVYRALQADSPRLATMGARTLVDLVILDKIGDVGTFEEKLKQLEAQGYVGAKNRAFLSAALEAGNAAAHRGHAPEPQSLNHVMDIVENLLEAVYALEKAAESLKETTPPRPKQRSGSPRES